MSWISRLLAFGASFVLLAGLTVGGAFWMDRQMLRNAEMRYRSLGAELDRRYDRIEAAALAPGKESLKEVNRSILRDSPAPAGVRVDVIFNFGPDGSLVALAGRQGSSVTELLRLQDQLAPAVRSMKMTHRSDTGLVILPIKHDLPRSGLFTTALGLHDPSLDRQRKVVQASAAGLGGVLTLSLLLAFFWPTRKKTILDRPRDIRSFKPDTGRFSYSGVTPMAESPFQRRTRRPPGERFYKEEYLKADEESSDGVEPATKEPPETKLPDRVVSDGTFRPGPILPAEEVERPAEPPRSFEEVQGEKKRLESRLEEITILREISLASSSISDLNEFMGAVLTLLRSRFHADEMEIFLADPGEPNLRRRARLQDYKVNFEDQRAIVPEHRMSLETGDEGPALARHQAVLRRIDGLSILSAPLLDKGRLIGALRFTAAGDGYSESDRFLVLAVARHVAVSLNNVALYETATRDALTGLWGVRHFSTILSEELKKSHRYKDSLALAMLDVDHFKKVNDTWGHPAGDKVLQTVAEVLRKEVRDTDSVFRCGGEEFAVLLPRTDRVKAREVLERMRLALENEKIAVPSGASLRVTASFGFTSLEFRPLAKELLIQEADRALYLAKETGRNRVKEFGES